jgi:hypothetical protein
LARPYRAMHVNNVDDRTCGPCLLRNSANNVIARPFTLIYVIPAMKSSLSADHWNKRPAPSQRADVPARCG